MELIISLMFYQTWVFRMHDFKIIIFTICKQISQISIKISKKEGKFHLLQLKKKSVSSCMVKKII